jgi:hypothetical protein
MSVESDVAAVASTAVSASPIGAIFTSAKLYIILFIIGAVVAAGIGLKLYIDNQNSKITALTKQVADQQVAITQDEQAIQLTQQDVAGLKVLTDGFNKQIATIQMNSNKVSTEFNSTTFQSTVKSNPTQAASQISTDINSLFDDVNTDSRAPLGASSASAASGASATGAANASSK